jgi:two-component system chemotaxis response regulator CheY
MKQEHDRQKMIKSILTIDDSKITRSLVRHTLENLGYQVTEAVDGADGLRKAKEQKFSIVITDQNMPNLEGIPLIRILRALPDYKSIPILLLTTGLGEKNLKDDSKKAGATGVLIKPFNPEKLAEVVKKLIG